jgi:broad specificity phosphatase PhoE
MKHSLLFALVLTLCPAVSAKTIVFVRHAEKASKGQDPDLTPAGKKRAALLAKMLSSAKIKSVYSTPTVRTRQTATPTARMHKLEVLSYEDNDKLLPKLRELPDSSGVTLVVGHTITLPGLISGLTGQMVSEIPESDYSRFFVVTLNKDTSELLELKY